MARPFRLDFSVALYHVTSRGNRQEAIYESDSDREYCLSKQGEGYTLKRIGHNFDCITLS